MKITQKVRVLKHLEKGYSISTFNAMYYHGIADLQGVIDKLKTMVTLSLQNIEKLKLVSMVMQRLNLIV